MLAALLAVLRIRSQKLQASEEHMNFLALHDSLTGLPNRAHFNDRLDKALSNVKVASLAVLYLDLDRFKQVNDTLGHPVGDELIRQFTARLKGVVEDKGFIARLGGDEFTVIVLNARVCRRLKLSARISSPPFAILSTLMEITSSSA